jgi:hypothetical protein
MVRLKTLIIFGAGYIYGARAGAQRYQEITSLSKGILGSEGVRSMVDRAATVLEDSVAKVPGIGAGLREMTATALGGAPIPKKSAKPGAKASEGKSSDSKSSEGKSSEGKSSEGKSSSSKSSNGDDEPEKKPPKKATSAEKSKS